MTPFSRPLELSSEVRRVCPDAMWPSSRPIKKRLVVAKVVDELRGDHDRVRIADPDRDDRDERVVAHEDVRRRHPQHPRALVDDRVHVRELAGVHAQAASQQPAARERDVDHRDDQQQRQFLPAYLMLQDPA
ncbi:hypothetical protein WPS_01120 [Vulcanimicrobium alpinum]|uniref:Uncharacterized protein n=1 Tax=Vulcanimicrobium alpinum TaxID=3016050 RepID=A0AAN1XUU6_UNVUL|nr:hypothetical protein [Vulcanimicrobium alpinum]BDE04836.1 hypothetical protein WPS_01120 [Vulcanimicrobium alpinum]